MDGGGDQALSGGKHPSLAGKLLLSSALVAISLAYGWWQSRERAPGVVAVPMLKPPAPSAPSANVATVPGPSAMTAREEAPKSAPTAPESNARPAPKEDRAAAPSSAPVTQDATAGASPPPLSALATLRMYLPPPPQIPLPLVTGTPAPGAATPVPAGMHLLDGDYLSDRHQFEWGDLQVKILIRGGQIIGAQLVQYPDHRALSLQLSQMAGPILNSEVIKTQQSKVDVVSSATDTSYVYQDAIANALFKATRQ